MTETWANIKGYRGLYQVSDKGRVRRVVSKSPLEYRYADCKPNTRGYIMVHLSLNGSCRKRSIHQLVAKAFIPNPDGKPMVNHKNGIKTDNRVENLEWVTCIENVRHAISTGLRKVGGSNNPNAKPVINCRGQVFNTVSEAAEHFNIASSSNIVKCCRGKIHYSGRYTDGVTISWKYWNKEQSTQNDNTPKE